MGICIPCGFSMPDPDLTEHIRLEHALDYGDGPERWADGDVVVVHENTLDPDDFREPQARQGEYE